MAKYQNVGTPRFYVDYFQYAITTGILSDEDINVVTGNDFNLDQIRNLFYLNPTKTNIIKEEYLQEYDNAEFKELNIRTNTNFKTTDYAFDYYGILNHNLKEIYSTNIEGGSMGLGYQDNNSSYAVLENIQNTNSINMNVDQIDYNGFSFVDLKSGNNEIGANPLAVSFDFRFVNEENVNLKLGALTAGYYYDMPHSPDLDLTLTREYGGSTKQFTKGGYLLTNYNYTQPPTWGESEPWGTYTNTPRKVQKRRAGRRRWDLKFSYIASSDLMADTETLDIDVLLNSGFTDFDVFVNNSSEYDTINTILSEDRSFFTQFMQKTLGGSLRFIFQPDKTDFTPDGFAICVLDQDSISFKQVAHNTYNVSLKILEVW